MALLDRVIRLSVPAVIVSLCLPRFLFAQADSSAVPHDSSRVPPLELVISTKVDTLNSDLNALKELMGNGAVEETITSVNSKCEEKIGSILKDQNIDIKITPSDSGCGYGGKSTQRVCLVNTLSVDSWGMYKLRSELLFTDKTQPLRALRREIKSVTGTDRDVVVESLASSVSVEVGQTVANWLVESLYKIRVMVNDFESDNDTIFAFLKQGLKTMTESELVRNEAFLVYSDEDSLSGNYISRAFANYQIQGSYVCLEGSIRIDIHCLKTRSGRILLSRSITLDTMTLSKLSGQFSLAMNRIKKAMLADDNQGGKTLAVVAAPPNSYFQSEGVSDETVDITRIFRRNVANRLRRFIQIECQNTKTHCVSVIDDADVMDRYLESYHDPGEIISDLAADYLILLKVEDLGQRLRIVATMHSYSTDSLIFGDLLFDDDENKSNFRNLMDRTLLKIAWVLCKSRLYDDSAIYALDMDDYERRWNTLDGGSKDSLISIVNRNTEGIPVLDIRANKGFGARLGGAEHKDEKLYLGQKTGSYLEIFYSFLFPHWNRLPAGIDNELELSVGMDYGGGNLLRRRLTSLKALLDFRFVMTYLKYSDFPFTAALGGGLGIGGIDMNYRAYEFPYAGSFKVNDAATRFLYFGSGLIEIPVIDWLRLQFLVRFLFQFGSPISRFENLAFDKSVQTPVKGKLTSRQITIGFKAVFR